MVTTRFAGRVRPTQAYEGRDPTTGQTVTRGPGLAVDDNPHDPAALEIRLSMGLDFDAHGVTKLDVSAAPVADTETWHDAEWARFNDGVADVLRRLGRRLQLGDLSVELQEQHWTVDGVRITVAIDTGPGDFMLMMSRPDAER